MRYNVPLINLETGEYAVHDLYAQAVYPWIEVPERPSTYHTWNNDIEDWEFNRNTWLDLDIRPLRNQLLQETDFFLLIDRYELLSTVQQQEIKVYRQALRDFTAIANYENLIWPLIPEWA